MKWMKLIWTAAVCAALIQELYANMETKMNKSTDSRGRRYYSLENDPFQVRVMKLKNGLTLVLSKNPLQPSVSVMIAVRAGSTDEPEQSTGLAHYFEHMMFKGTSKIGTLDWKKESLLLDKIKILFEERRNEKDPEKRKMIYREIDRLSGKAAKYAAAGEYSTLVTSLGGAGLNAATGMDFTGYHVTVPSNELEKLLKLESERFREPVLRLFHTELEAVYEEFNRAQDNDSRRGYEALLKALHPVHPAGRPIIGKPEHLKAPSMRDIETFFKKYYVPSNMVLVIAGDLDYEKTFDMIEQTFGQLPKAPVPVRSVPKDPVLRKDISLTVKGPEGEYLLMGYSFPVTKENMLFAQLFSSILSDNGYGLFDQELVLPQKVLSADAGLYFGRESIHLLIQIRPRDGQKLDDAEKKMRKVLAKAMKGNFESWRIKAVAANCRVLYAKLRDSDPMDFAWEMVGLFAADDSYTDWLTLPDRMEKISRTKLAALAEMNLAHAVIVRKETGKAENVVKVEKPSITPVTLNAGKISEYGKRFLASKPSPPVKPDFPDFKNDILLEKLSNGTTLKYIRKKSSSDIFTLRIQSDIGKHHDRLLPLSAMYFNFVGTKKFSAAEFRQELYKSGLKCTFTSDRYHTFAEITGPGKSFEDGVKLIGELLRNYKGEKESYRLFAEGILKSRKDDALNPQKVFQNTLYRSLYGKNDPVVQELVPEKELKDMCPNTLLAAMGKLLTSPDATFVYAGPASEAEVRKVLSQWKPGERRPKMNRRIYDPEEVKEPVVYLINTDKVQLSVGFTSCGGIFDPEQNVNAILYDTYFGGGLNSVVFHEIRESRALAYSAGGTYSAAEEKGRKDMIYMVAGTQPDKLDEMIATMLKLLKKMPERQETFETARKAVLKNFETARYYGMGLAERQEAFERMGVDMAWSRNNYKRFKSMTIKKLADFAEKRIGKKKFNIVICGDLTKVNRKRLGKYGKIVELSRKDVFGY